MRREPHVRICERLGVKFPGPTRRWGNPVPYRDMYCMNKNYVVFPHAKGGISVFLQDDISRGKTLSQGIRRRGGSGLTTPLIFTGPHLV